MFKLKMVRVVISLVLLLISFSVSASPDYWIDVRSKREFKSGHIDGAINISHRTITDHISSITTDKDAEIYLYCHSGGRAGVAEKALKKMGYTNVKNIGGLKDAQNIEPSVY